MGRAGVEASAHGSVLALRVLAEDDHVDIAGFLASQRRFHARVEIGGSDADTLVKAAPHGQEQTVQGDVVGYVGVAHSAEQYGVEAFQRFDAILGHEVAGLPVVFRTPGELGELKTESIGDACHSLKGLSAFVDDL